MITEQDKQWAQENEGKLIGKILKDDGSNAGNRNNLAVAWCIYCRIMDRDPYTVFDFDYQNPEYIAMTSHIDRVWPYSEKWKENESHPITNWLLNWE